MLCQQCGSELIQGNNFCNSCGSKITNDSNTPVLGQIISSPSAFSDELSRFNIWYYVLGGIAAFFGLIRTGLSGMVVLCIVAIGIVYGAIQIIAAHKVDNLRKIKYHLPRHIDKEALTGLLAAPLSQYGMIVENVTGALSDCVRINHNRMQYEVYLDTEENIFTIWAQEPISKRLILGRQNAKLYRRAIVALPIIAFSIQDSIKTQQK